MPANFEKVESITRIAGGDYSQPGVGQYRFCVINPNSVVPATGLDNPGLWYGSAQGPAPIAGGNVIVNTSAGGACFGVLLGKARAGEAIEVGVGGRLLVVCGGTVAAGDSVGSDAAGAAVTHSGSNHILGVALEAGVAGDIISISFDRAGTA